MLEGPGLVPLDVSGLVVPPPDAAAEPAGFVVLSDDGTRIHFLDWGGPPEATTLPGATMLPGATTPPDATATRGEPAPPGQAAPPTATAPGVLLVPGLATTAWAWSPVARRLRSRARVAAMDVRGHGLSDAPAHGYDPDQLAGDAIAAAEGSGVLQVGSAKRSRFVIAGHGFGAIVAAWAANALGDRCAGLVLVDGGWEDVAAASGATPAEWLAAIEEPPAVLASIQAWLADRRDFDPASWDADQERAVRAQVVETAAGRVKLAVHPHALAGSVEALFTYDPGVVLSGVEASVVALVARDDEAGGRAAALRSVAARRSATGRAPIAVAPFGALGHNLPRYVPDAVTAAILVLAGPRPTP